MNTQIDIGTMDSPVDAPGALDGVLTRRSAGFVIDYLIIGLGSVALFVAIFLLGLVTFAIGWSLFLVFGPLVVFMTLFYIWTTLGGPSQATPGMRAMGVKLVRLDGAPIDGPTAIVHSVLFWVGNAVLTPLILLVPLFTDYKRALHDLLLGTAVIRSDT